MGMFEDKYEWAGNVLSGDCGLVIHDASIEYDVGSWLCQVTASDFTQKDTLISGQITIIVRGETFKLHINDSIIHIRFIFSVSPKNVLLKRMQNMINSVL